MGLHKDHDWDESHLFSDLSTEETGEDLRHRTKIRKKLEEKLERRRLKEEFDELDGEFNWDDYDK